MKFLTEDNEAPSLQVAPLMDIIFLLLIFFVTTSALETFEKNVSIDLPASDLPALATKITHTVYVELSQDGTIELQNKVISEAELADKLTRLSRHNPDQKVIIRADKNVIWEKVVQLSGIVAKAGVKKIFYSIIDRLPEE